jgi:NAD dependent epimerase/dehydratase family enzyme
MSWIHHDDLVGLFLLALDRPDVTGPINGTAPNPVRNKQFGRALGRAMRRPSFFWTPGFMLRLMLGEVANVVTRGQRVLPQRAPTLGYSFKYPTIDEALKEILS